MNDPMIFKRDAILIPAGVDEEKRTVEICFSSEAPVRRFMGGTEGVEVLDHSPTSVDLSRLNDGAPLLVEHERVKQVGVVLKAWIDSDKRARAIVKFGRSRAAKEIMDDVADGIRKCVSVGYEVLNYVKERAADGETIFRVDKWMPLEVSLVSIPADATVGVGRAAEAVGVKIPVDTEPTNKPETKMSETKIEAVRDVRSEEIAALGKKHGAAIEAVDYIAGNKSVDEFKNFLIERQANARPLQSQKQDELGMSKRELKGYSLLNAIRARANGLPLEGLEAEAAHELAKRSGITPRGFFVPVEVFKRDLTTSNSGAAIATGLGQYISPLLADSVAVALGATVYNGITGNLSLPRGSNTTGVWVAENAASSENTPTIGQLLLTPKRVTGFVDLSKTLLSQSSVDVESQTRNNLVAQLSLAIDKAAISGAGGVEPTGIVNTASVGEVTAVAIDRDVVVDLEAAVAAANALSGTSAYLMTHSVKGTLKKTQLGTSGRFLMEGAELNGYRALSSTQADGLIFGAFENLVIVTFGAMDVLVDPYTQGSANIVRVYTSANADAGVKHAAAFAKFVAA